MVLLLFGKRLTEEGSRDVVVGAFRLSFAA